MIKLRKQFGLNCINVVATVTDNASNFVKTLKEFGILTNLRNSDEDDNEVENDNDCEFTEVEFTNSFVNTEMLLKHYRCATHTLNLIATSDFIKDLKQNLSSFEKHISVSILLKL